MADHSLHVLAWPLTAGPLALLGALAPLPATPEANLGSPARLPLELEGDPHHAGEDGIAALEDLANFQARLESVLEEARPATVCLRMGGQSGSGVIVSPEGLVLTAAHVVAAPNAECSVVLFDGRELPARSLGLNHLRDSALVQIEGDHDDLPFVEIPPPHDLEEGSWCVALGHPGGIEPGRGPVPRLGRIQDPGGLFVWTDSAIIGGDSGGPLFDLDGRLIGIHSRIEADVANNYHVPISTIRLSWKRLLAGEEWRRASAKMGVLRLANVEGGVRLDALRTGRPADAAGLVAGDVVTHLNGELVRDRQHLEWFLTDLSPGDGAVVRIRRAETGANDVATTSQLEIVVTLSGTTSRIGARRRGENR